jgi:hypothetical protein
MTAILWNPKSSNAKTGPMPVSTTGKDTCAPSCPFAGNGCYAESGPLAFLWNAMTKAGENAEFKNGRATMRTTDWSGLCKSVAELPAETLWRHNQAGDLPHNGGKIDATRVAALVDANEGKRGFTYTHHNALQDSDNRAVVADANARGFTINLSGNNLRHADALADLGVAPVVTVLPSTVAGKADITTPKGRKVVVCPATYREDVSCATCGLCGVRDRKVVVGFPAHGTGKKKADAAHANA